MTHVPVTCSVEPWDTSMDTLHLPMRRALVLYRTETGYRRSQGSPQTEMLKYLFIHLQICSPEPITKAV